MDYLQKIKLSSLPGTPKINKLHSKSIKKVIDDKMDVGMDVGRLWDRFFIDFGTVLGGKLAPSWHQNPKKEGTNTMSKNEWLKTHAGVRGVGECGGGSGPLKTFKNTLGNPLETYKEHDVTPLSWRCGGYT